MSATVENGILPPRANPTLIGHEQAEAALLAAWASGRMPHAWILSGPRGIGKATLAFRFARFALASGSGQEGMFAPLPSPSSLELPGDAPVFRMVAASAHPDLITVERSVDQKRGRLREEIVVEDVRDVGAFLRLTPAAGGWRVVVVDSADDLNRNSANALLKVLEEPPRRALILLVCHAPGRLLPTIRSRCRLLALSGLDDALVEGYLARHRPDLDPADRRALARIAEGSIGHAVDLADAGGLDLYRSLVDMLTRLPDLDIERLHAFADRVGRADEEGRTFRALGELIGWWLARLARGSARGGFLPELVAGEGAAMARLAHRRGLDQWALLWEKMARLFARADSANLDRRQVVLTAFLDLAAFARG